MRYELPNGTKVRCESTRAYVLIGQWNDGETWIEKRSDDARKLTAIARRSTVLHLARFYIGARSNGTVWETGR